MRNSDFPCHYWKLNILGRLPTTYQGEDQDKDEAAQKIMKN